MRRIQYELLRDDQGTNLGKEEKSPRFQAVNEQENILHLTTKHKKQTRFETCCTNASLEESGLGTEEFGKCMNYRNNNLKGCDGILYYLAGCHRGESPARVA